MTGETRPAGRFLGRPEGAYPGFVPDREGEPAAPDTGDVGGVRHATVTRPSRLWLVQAVTGALLLAFLGVHLVAQHLFAPGGLRDHASVLAYLREPLALAAEIGLLLAVVAHACLGLRSSLVDVIRDPRLLHRVSVGLAVLGALVAVYAVWLTLTVVGAGGA